VTNAGWPPLNQSTYYWIVLAPSTTLSINDPAIATAPKFNGAIWAGINSATAVAGAIPPIVRNDAQTFTARVIRSQPVANNAFYSSTAQGAINWINAALALTSDGWAVYAAAGTRLVNWQAAPATGRIVYGLQVVGNLPPTPSGACVRAY
jgi:hypothetical protein